MVSFRGVIYISVINVLQNRTRSHTRYTNQGVAYWYPEAYKKEFLKYKTGTSLLRDGRILAAYQTLTAIFSREMVMLRGTAPKTGTFPE